MHGAAALLELGGVILGLGILGRLAGRLGLSAIPLYLLAGLAFGEGGLLPLVTASEFIEIGAEVGVRQLPEPCARDRVDVDLVRLLIDVDGDRALSGVLIGVRHRFFSWVASMPPVAWRVGVSAVGITVADLAVGTVDHDFASLVDRDLPCTFDRCGLRGVSRAVLLVACASHAPSVAARNYMLVTSCHFLVLRESGGRVSGNC